MKQEIASLANKLLSPFGFKLVGKKSIEFSMKAMLCRLHTHSQPFRTVVDIGASDGKWSVACMKIFPQCNYFAIEALKEREKPLAATKQRYKTFDYEICIAGDADGGETLISVAADLDGSAVDAYAAGEQRRCPVRTVNSIISEHALAGPYLLKFDTHGFEVPILSGCSETLKNTSALVMECYNFGITPGTLRFHDMCSHMEKLGFRPADIADPMLRNYDNAFWQIDILFLPINAKTFGYSQYE